MRCSGMCRICLLNKFLDQPFPKMFMFGAQYASLSYLPQLRQCGVALVEVWYCGHFPMYANPKQMEEYIEALHRQCKVD